MMIRERRNNCNDQKPCAGRFVSHSFLLYRLMPGSHGLFGVLCAGETAYGKFPL